MNNEMDVLKDKMRGVYKNPYSYESHFILQQHEEGLAFCFEDFYILLSEKDNKWTVEEYED